MARAPKGTLSLGKKVCIERNFVFGDSILIKLGATEVTPVVR